MELTPTHWVTIVIFLVGIISNLGWFLLTRSVKTLDDLKTALTGDNGAVARIHQRIDKLGEVYHSRETAEMQFEHLRQLMDDQRRESERRHQENIDRLADIKKQAKEDSDALKEDVRTMRSGDR